MVLRPSAVVALAVGLTAAAAAAQQPTERVRSGTASVAGRITEADTRRPLGGVLVTLIAQGLRARLATVTTPDGRYLFEGIAPAPYILQADSELVVDEARQAASVALRGRRAERFVVLAHDLIDDTGRRCPRGCTRLRKHDPRREDRQRRASDTRPRFRPESRDLVTTRRARAQSVRTRPPVRVADSATSPPTQTSAEATRRQRGGYADIGISAIGLTRTPLRWVVDRRFTPVTRV